MKKWLSILFLLMACQIFGQEEQPLDNEWLEHRRSGLALSQEKEYEAASVEYSQAIYLLGEKERDHVHLYNDRGLSYLFLKRYQEAILDFTVVIEAEEAPLVQTIQALWGRATGYAALDDLKSFKQDYERLKIIDPAYPKVEYTKDYVIFSNFNHTLLSDDARNKFCCAMIHLDICKSKQDIQFNDSNVCLVKRRCQCGCEKIRKERAYEQEHGKICDCCGTLIYPQVMAKANDESEDCKDWCDRVLQASFVICDNQFEAKDSKLMYTAIIESLKEGCLWYCDGEGFYNRCLQPFENFISKAASD